MDVTGWLSKNVIKEQSENVIIFSYQKMLLKNILKPEVWYSKIMFREYFWQMLF